MNPFTFTKNQIDALRLAHEGKTTADIARMLSIKYSTADFAKKSASEKIDKTIALLCTATEIGGLNENQAKELKSLLQKL